MCLLQHPYIASLLATYSSIPPSHSFSQSVPSLSTYFLFFSTLHSFPTFFPSASPFFTLFLQFSQSSVPSTPQYTTLFWHTPSPALCPIFYIFSSSSGLRTHMTNIMRKHSWQYALPTLPSCYTPGAKNSFCTKLHWWVLSNLSSLWKKIQLASSRIFSKIILWGSRSSAARFSQGARIQFRNYRSMNCPKIRYLLWQIKSLLSQSTVYQLWTRRPLQQCAMMSLPTCHFSVWTASFVEGHILSQTPVLS